MRTLLVTSPAARRFARRATFRRSLSLLSDFKYEQARPDLFYGAIARDTATMLDDLHQQVAGHSIQGTTILDVGGGPGYFADVFHDRGAQYLSVEPDPSEMHAAGISFSGSVRGSGMALPIRTSSVDICYSSNVAEHVPTPWAMADEMLRVTKPGGLMVLSYTLWWGPFGGHETGQWHFLGGEYAARRYARKNGKEPKNRFGTSLFPITASAGLRWARQATAPGANAELVAAFPRYNPWWSWWATSIPILRELMVSNLVIVVRKK
ncbi:class I SAM-dependent methyltransferase [Hoyosella rhizosphaerae]|uniref:Methyltransferase n=1 Tax=Hoyosella rhizosphaerae TaxID=1755582 RepID=A0A916U6I8_9ACTN|nr:putative methyltransferase [Hoyosella rhizosphaerae]